jgi:hypothetical protein
MYQPLGHHFRKVGGGLVVSAFVIRWTKVVQVGPKLPAGHHGIRAGE